MSKPCPQCGRLNTIHNFGQGCFGCNPPDFSLRELVPIDVFGAAFLVERGKAGELNELLTKGELGSASIVETKKPHMTRPVRTVREKWDTGMCGNQTFNYDDYSLRDYIAMRFGAILDQVANPAIEDHNRQLAYLKQRAIEDAAK